MKSVAIIALASWSQPHEDDLGQFDEIWSINEGHSIYGHKPTLIIAMDDLERDEARHPEYVKTIVDAGVPVLSTGTNKKWPSVEPYPLQEVCDFLSKYWDRPENVLDNTCNYAFSLALARGYGKIAIYGFDWCLPYKNPDLALASRRWDDKGYGHAPGWFKYYDGEVVTKRRPREPGIEGFHFLLGLARSSDITIILSEDTTILNHDRDRFFYGYQEQPEID